MAAPTISKSRDACLKKIINQEKSSAKISRKNILCPEFQDWPRPSTETADVILSKLSDKLKSLPNIFTSPKHPSESDQEGKRKIRSQLEIGVSAVFRALEKDRLSCVLVSGQAKPAAIVDHVISLARDRGCPLLCLDALSTTLSKVTKTKALPLCIGFKTISSEAEFYFTEIVSLIRANTKVTRPPITIDNCNNSNMSVRGTNLEELPTKLLSESLRPISVDLEKDKEILTELKRILLESTVKPASEKDHGGKKKKQKKPKPKLKDLFIKSIHCHFEIGKRTVAEILDRGRLQLVLVSPDIVPHLMTESSSNSLLTIAKRVACPVICIPDLTPTLRSVAGISISVMGFKKFSCLPPGTSPVFQSIIEKYLETIQKSASVEGKFKSSSTTITVKSQKEIVKTKKEAKEKAIRDKEIEEEEEEEEDYTYLHIMKNDSVEYQESMSQMKKEVEEYSRNENLQANFISLDSGNKTNSKVTKAAHSNLGKRKQSDELQRCDSELKSETKKRMIVDNASLPEGLVPVPKLKQNQGNKDNVRDKCDFLQQEAQRENIGFNITPSSNQEKETIIADDVERANDKNIAKHESLSSKSNTTEAVSTSPLFAISRKGDDPTNASMPFAIAKSASAKSSTTNVMRSECQKDQILGEETLPSGKKTDAEMKAEHIKKVFEATAISSCNKKKKRKHGSKEGFISLAYTEANIHTMVNDVSKKKKKKKK